MRLFALFSLFSLFSPTCGRLGIAARIDAKGPGQPTRSGHTLTRCPLPGLARACRPSNLAKGRKPGSS